MVEPPFDIDISLLHVILLVGTRSVGILTVEMEYLVPAMIFLSCWLKAGGQGNVSCGRLLLDDL